MWNKIKNKKLYIIILSLLFVIVIVFGIFYKKIEAPVSTNDSSVLGNTEKTLASEEQATPQKPIVNSDGEKYTIVGRTNVVPKNILNKEKVILLTIDDGPSTRTKEMMVVLKKHNAKAIFFINGMHDKNNPDVIAETAKEGFAVGNHTWDHLNLKREKDNSKITKEINKNSELIEKITGSKPRFFRAPYGESNPYIRKLVKDDGMIFMDWSGAAMDWEKATKEQDVFISNVMKNLHSGSIILIHEHPWSLANLDALLTKLDNDGYKYVDPNNIVE